MLFLEKLGPSDLTAVVKYHMCLPRRKAKRNHDKQGTPIFTYNLFSGL